MLRSDGAALYLGGLMSRAIPRRPIDVFSIALLIAMHVACVLVFVVPFSWGVVAFGVGSYVLRMFAITAGYHRYFSHRAYKTSRAFQFVLAVLGTASMQNGPLWWASWHRHHHKHSDTKLDAHSPRHVGFWDAHIGWIFDGEHDAPILANVRDLVRYPELRFLERHKWLPLIAYALGCLAIGGWSGLVWGFVLSTVALSHCTMLINSLSHVWGTRPYPTADTSRNNALLAFITLGEGWHNNHHHYMSSARQGFRWWEIDVSFYALTVLSWLGIVWDLRSPPVETRFARRASAPKIVPDLGAVGLVVAAVGAHSLHAEKIGQRVHEREWMGRATGNEEARGDVREADGIGHVLRERTGQDESVGVAR
jgi:stearoyl-CoA desaturase (delta-9 desaturase)